MKKLFLVAASMLFIGCATSLVPPTSEIPAEEISYKAVWDSNPSGAEWTKFTIDALDQYGEKMVNLENPADAEVYCPKFKSLNFHQKNQLWVTLISAMAKRESSFKPETSYKEGFNDSKGNPVISRGLLQISKESANQRAYGCGIDKESELHDPKTNLTCGVKILSKWIPQDNLIGSQKLGGGRYWSVLRDTSSSQAYIRQQTMALDFCK